jgi:hypothetical protein
MLQYLPGKSLPATSITAILLSCQPPRQTSPNAVSTPRVWPEIVREHKPLARWWWIGSATDEKKLLKLLGQYRDAGFGSVARHLKSRKPGGFPGFLLFRWYFFNLLSVIGY